MIYRTRLFTAMMVRLQHPDASEACSGQPESLSIAIGGSLMCVGGVVGESDVEGSGRTDINRAAFHICLHPGSAGHLCSSSAAPVQ